MARLAGVPLYVVHVSTRQGIEAVRAARRAGQTALAETCPQYLLLDESRYQGDAADAAAFVMSPPLRGSEHQEALWAALASGIVHTLATDHCPFRREQKSRFAASDFTRIPGGVGGIEYRLSLLYTFGVLSGKISLARFVDLVSTRPAKIFGLFPRKGTIRAGSDADLVVWDPSRQSTATAARQWQHCDHTVYEGLQLCGAPRFVIRGGTPVFADGRFAADPGPGVYLARGRRRGGDAS
jgi:dihydropyrimidinase